MFFLKSALAVAGVCVIALLIILSQPRHMESVTPKETVVLEIPTVRVPGAARFPTQTDDSVICTTINYPYEMAKTEVTYGQWKIVYDWAIGHGYIFVHKGSRGGYYNNNHDYKVYTSGHENYPVTRVSWYDAIVWCNALTEFYNSQKGTDYSCVYQYNGAVIQDATDTSACDNVNVAGKENGFRLPTIMEWELAARYIDGNHWTPGNYASGTDGSYNNEDTIKAVAWYDSNSGNSTHPVGIKTPNDLGIYDMSGNVQEWCFNWYQDKFASCRIERGGGWYDDAYSLQIGNGNFASPNQADNHLGFRPVRTL